MRIATLNVQNMRLRHGPQGDALDGARDRDSHLDTGPAAGLLDSYDRQLTAALIRDTDADVLALQEVFDAETLDHFHDHYLLPSGAAPYPHRICLPGNDGRGLDLALLSRIAPDRVESHAALTPRDAGLGLESRLDPDVPLFRRDCLEVEIGELTLFICHFKAPYPDVEKAWQVRRAEALSVRHLIETQFPDPASALWLVLGDLNDPRDTPKGRDRAIAPLLPPFSVNLLDRVPEQDRWSWYQPEEGVYACPDKMLASPALAHRFPEARPSILREGLGHETRRYGGPFLPGTGTHRPHASDHAALSVRFPGL
ncbi:endonuclease/exonuclease/phosphatase family protein [Marimonas lutisalis]|uniref:endonuclease/exonuclease/phosphatase family protein n=1 Tax=Marimonas lutisalis TaxID=2545756 RepID=UPI0010F53FD9|nr:endonuclease/exonuclease/phosphatase family protein [Marimonas lutisalis]